MDIGQLVVVPGAGTRSEAEVTLAPPVAERDARFPLRGRSALVEDLLRLCQEGSDGRVHVLHGMSGCGKTAVALEVVTCLQATGDWCVWWVDARHTATFAACMRAVARQAGLEPTDAWGGSAADALWERLGSSARKWLLVVDNAEDLAVLDGPGRLAAGTGWLRPHPCATGVVLATTRHGMSRLWGAAAVLHAVRPLDGDEAAQVLLDHAGEQAGSLDAARVLGDRLGGLPLALSMAGSYLAEVNSMPRSFRGPGTPSDFCSYRQALNEHGSSLNPAWVVARAWQMSVRLLHQMGFAHASWLLEVLAAFSEAPVPYTLLLRPSAVSSAAPSLGDLDGRTLWRTLREFAALGLIDPLDVPAKHGGLPCVRLHPLIRDIARADGTAAVRLIEQALALEEVRVPPEDPQSWAAWEALTPHALDLLRHAGEGRHQFSEPQRTVCAQAAELAARYLQSQGMFIQARREFERVLDLRREVLGPDHLETITTMHNLASVLHDLGELGEAERLRTHVWRALERVQGAEHHDTLTARHELGRLLHDRGQLDAAEEHLRTVFEARRQAGGHEDPDALAARHELARVLHDRGDLEGARQEYRALVSIRLRLLGEDHPRTVTARHNLACVLYDLGRLREAQDECLPTWEVRKRLYGSAHPKTMATAHLLATVLYGLSSNAEACRILEEVCEESPRMLGVAHPQTRRYAETLAHWRQEFDAGNND
ncbi:tetratricopeptide repeat protein [Streptomyces mirabilis]|uniref:tetratricopeptide repeat protein n=1 Tax=Streptomyces mirabilis TaxID=68239 RepID=UPI003828AE78